MMPSGHKIPAAAARLSIAAAGACLLPFAGLHVLSPEVDPSLRVVSLMFAAWAVSTWALAWTIWPQAQTRTGRIGLGFLGAAGVGEAMASVFGIHDPLHGVAGLLGVGGLPVAAMSITPAPIRIPGWSDAKRALLWIVVLHCVWVTTVAGEAIGRRNQFIQTREGMSGLGEGLP